MKLCLFDESNDMGAHARHGDLLWAWRQWEMECCIERNRGHQWRLELEHPDEGSGVYLACLNCSAGVDDLYPDGIDFLFLEYGDVTVSAGVHNSPEPLVIPVEVEVWVRRFSSPIFGEDYDAGIDMRAIDCPRRWDGFKHHG